MGELFDGYKSSYGEVVERSIRFSGLRHDFFLMAKSDLLRRLVIERGLRHGGAEVRALDIGCGIGSLHPHLDGVFDTLNGCDISEQSIMRARQNNPTHAYHVSTLSRLPYEDGAFDLAFASCVLHHVPPDCWEAFFKEMQRVLRPHGLACIIEHNPYNPLTRLAVFRCPFDNDAVLLSSRTAASLFQIARFAEIRSEHFLLLPTAGSFTRKVESWLAPLPLGAQYACSARA